MFHKRISKSAALIKNHTKLYRTLLLINYEKVKLSGVITKSSIRKDACKISYTFSHTY